MVAAGKMVYHRIGQVVWDVGPLNIRISLLWVLQCDVQITSSQIWVSASDQAACLQVFQKIEEEFSRIGYNSFHTATTTTKAHTKMVWMERVVG